MVRHNTAAKLILSTVCALLMMTGGGLFAKAQTATTNGIKYLDELYSHLETNRITFDYSCALSGISLEAEGKVIMQGDCYRADVNGTVVICDGKTVWSIDSGTREVYIDNPPQGGVRALKKYKNDFKSLSFSNIRYLPLSEDLSEFSFDVSTLDPQKWDIVDLR